MRTALKPRRISRYRTLDAHAAGEPLRLILEGFPPPKGRTMLEKRAWVKKHADHVRRALMLEPRGHADMYGAVLTEPVTPGADAGVLFMHNEGYSTMCGHGIIAVTKAAETQPKPAPTCCGDRRTIHHLLSSLTPKTTPFVPAITTP